MNFRGLLVTRTKTEVLSGFLALASSVVGLITAIVDQEARVVTLSVLALMSLSALVWFGVLVTRSAFTIRGYNEVVTLLAKLAEKSRHRLWTVRSHTGAGGPEAKYFQSIEDRLRDRISPLEDFRRIVRLCPNACDDLKTLISRFYRLDNVSVHYYDNQGPQFDFMVVDGRIGVIGFPMVGGYGNVGAVVLRRPEAVKGLETIFEQLFRESQLLFEGDERHTLKDENQLQKKLGALFVTS